MTVPPELAPGAVLFDRFALVRRLGAGGMGQVWEAVRLSNQEPVALKVLPADEPPHRLERFLREGRTLQRLRHPGIVRIEEVIEDPVHAALVMDRLEGETLADRLEAQPVLPSSEVARIGEEVARALVAAHEVGIVHRDVKPENIFLTADGGVRLIDFGIAVGLWGPTDTDRLTQTGILVGTPVYMSPEQLLHPKDVDEKADVWSLGLVMYECLAGFSPTTRESAGQVFQAILGADFPPLDDAPAPLRELVTAMLSKAPSDRPRSSEVVARLTGSPVPSASPSLEPVPPARVSSTPPRAGFRRRVWAAAVATYTLLFASGFSSAPAAPLRVARADLAPPVVATGEDLAKTIRSRRAVADPAPPKPAVGERARPRDTLLGRRIRGRRYRPIDRTNPYR
ncbi:MAG: protein kinase [Myxococcota bacterium]